jgi:3-polyprenyl-4-hydroxybenzoate decarboxylase
MGLDRLEVAVAVGASAAATFSAVAPLPPGVDELLFAAFLQGTAVDLVPCRSVELEVPFASEFVIEGYVPVDETRVEGPFGDHTGFYSLPDEYGVLHVTAVTHRKDAIWQCTVVGPPPQEDCWMGQAIERLFLPLQRKVMPEVLDMRLPFAGVFHNLMILKIKKDYPGQARKVAHSVWGLGQAMFTKAVIVVDEDGPDLRDDDALAKLFFERFDVSRDLEFVHGPTETLDHASRALHFGSKVSIDLTREFPGEGARSPAPKGEAPNREEVVAALLKMPGVSAATVLAGGGVAVAIDKPAPSVPRVTIEQVWDLGERQGWQAVTERVLVLDSREQLEDPVRLLWLCLSHIDPERDAHLSYNPTHDASLRRVLGLHPRRIGVDATSKSKNDGFERAWPTEQLHSLKLLNRVANHWSDMGLAGECP